MYKIGGIDEDIYVFRAIFSDIITRVDKKMNTLQGEIEVFQHDNNKLSEEINKYNIMLKNKKNHMK